MPICELPESDVVCELNLDLREHGLVKAVFTNDAELYYIWDVSKNPPFKFEYKHHTGDLYYKNVNEDDTMGERIFICNIKGEKGDPGPQGPEGKFQDLSNYFSKDEVQDLLDPLLDEIEDLKNQVTSLLNNKADKSELSTVATTGDYEDLTNKPNIPEFIDVTTEAEAQSTSTANPDAYVTYNDN